MGLHHSPRIITNGLVLCLDVANFKSFKGESTTNLSYNNGQDNSQYLSSLISWINSGTWTYNANETDVPKPNIEGFDTTNFRIQSGLNTTAGGSVHVGCAFTYLSPSTTYTVSVYYRQNRTNIAQPYLRTNVTNISLGNLNYNGDTNSSNWPINEWIRISTSGTTPANEDGIYISNYIGSNVGDKIYYFGHQVEKKTQMTPLVAGTRGSTVATGGGLADLSRNFNHCELVSGLTYNSKNLGTLVFDGSTGYLDIPNNSSLQISDNITIEMFCKISSINLGGIKVIANKYANPGWEFIVLANGNFQFAGRNEDGNYYTCDSGVNIADNQYHQLIGIKTGLYWKTYIDGVSKTTTTASSVGTLSNSVSLHIGKEGSGYHCAMNVALMKIYNRVLSDSEILQNYNAMKKRF